MAETSTPSSGSFARGVLVGLSPLLLLVFGACFIGLLASVVGPGGGPPVADDPTAPPLPVIDPNTPLTSLLPESPAVSKAPVYLGDDLSAVPELTLEATPQMTRGAWRDRKAYTAAAALHLNEKEEDGYLKALLAARPDLAGVPFTMGAAC